MHRNMVLLTAISACVIAADVPRTSKRPVTDIYHGISVVDDYRWLEDLKSSDVAKWIEAQNVYGRSYLDKATWRPKMYKQIEELLGGNSVVSYGAGAWANGRFFGLRVDPKLQQPQLIVFEDPNKPEQCRVLIDPDDGPAVVGS